MKSLILVLTILFCGVVHAKVDGTLTIEVDSADHSIYPVSQGGAASNISVEGRKITITAGGNAFMAKERIDDFEPGMYFDFPLLDHRLEYIVDLSQVGCSCNAALYFLKMPGYDASQQPDPSDWKNFYCDADQVAG